MEAEPRKFEILANLTSTVTERDARRNSILALVRRMEGMGQAREWYDALVQHIPADADDDLKEYLRYAILGVCTGFMERDLSPFLSEHMEIVPPLLTEIKSVYDQLAAGEGGYDPEEFRYRAYDYGLHKATYLDWRLYLSKEFY